MEKLLGSLPGLISTIVYFVIIFSVIRRVKNAVQEKNGQNGNNKKSGQGWTLLQQATEVLMQGQTPNQAINDEIKQRKRQNRQQRRAERKKQRQQAPKPEQKATVMQNQRQHQREINKETTHPYKQQKHATTESYVNFSKNDLKKAIIYSEIIGLPKSLRAETSGLPYEA